MTKQFRVQRSDLLWLAGIAFVVVLQFWWLPGTRQITSDSFSTTAGGKLGLVRILSKIFPDVRRSKSELVPPGDGTLLVLAPSRHPSRADVDDLEDFVRRGGTLVFAASPLPYEFDAGPLGFRLLPVEEPVEVTASSPLSTDDFRITPLTELKTVSWVRGADLVSDKQGRPLIASWTLGHGSIFVCTTDALFNNESMLDPVKSQLGIRIIELAWNNTRENSFDENNESIYVDESLNSKNAFRSVAVLLAPGFRTGTLQLFLAGLLMAWYGFHRFGPAINNIARERKSMTDSAMALGNLQFRSRDRSYVVRSYLEYLSTKLRRQFGTGVSLDNYESLSRRSGFSEDEIRQRLGNARKVAAGQGALNTHETANLIRWLATLNQKLFSSRPVSQ